MLSDAILGVYMAPAASCRRPGRITGAATHEEWQVSALKTPSVARRAEVITSSSTRWRRGTRAVGSGHGGEPQPLPTPQTLLTYTQATRLLGRHRAVGGQVRMDEHLSFYLAGRWLSSAVPGRRTPGRAEHAEERQCSQRGKRRGLATSQLLDAVKSCCTLGRVRGRISLHVVGLT